MKSAQEIQDTVLKQTNPVIYKAAIIKSPGKVEMVDLTIPELEENQVLVKLQGVGLCASNIPVWEGRDWFEYPLAPGAPGHEGWGTVEDVGSGVSELQIGERVAILQGNAFAEFMVVNEEDLISLPNSLDGIPFPGEPFGCVMNIFQRADIQNGQTVAIIGLGFVGLGILKLCQEKEVKILALSRRDFSLEMAKGTADHCIKMDDHYRVLEQINSLTSGKGCDRVIECTGKQWPLDLASAIVGEYGKLIIAGYHQDGLRKVNMQEWNWKAIDLINAHERDPKKYKQGIQEAIEAVEKGILKPNELLTHTFSFDQLQEGLDLLTEGPEGYIKGYVKFG
jgi:threonine dehydrogenase-like Zn-dependent dehydrogenase